MPTSLLKKAKCVLKQMGLTYSIVEVNSPRYYIGDRRDQVGGEYNGFFHYITINSTFANEARILDFTATLYHEMAHATFWDPGDITGYAYRREDMVRNTFISLQFRNRKISCCVGNATITEITDAWDDILEKCNICTTTPRKCRNIRTCHE